MYIEVRKSTLCAIIVSMGRCYKSYLRGVCKCLRGSNDNSSQDLMDVKPMFD